MNLDIGAATPAPDDAVLDGRSGRRGPLSKQRLPEAGHVDVQPPDQAAAAQPQRGAVGAHVVAHLPKGSAALDQHPLGHMHRLPAPRYRISICWRPHHWSGRKALKEWMLHVMTVSCHCSGRAPSPQAVVGAPPQSDDVAIPGSCHCRMQRTEAVPLLHCARIPPPPKLTLATTCNRSVSAGRSKSRFCAYL